MGNLGIPSPNQQIMKKLLFLSTAVLILTASFASTTPIKPRLKASEIMVPIGNGLKISLLDLSRISIKEVQELRGEKMKFADRMAFKAAQKKLRNNIHPDGTFDNKILKKLKKAEGDGGGFHLGGFALGFLLGLIGVLIAYIINDDLKRTRVKWAWIGFLVFVAIYLVIFLVV